MSKHTSLRWGIGIALVVIFGSALGVAASNWSEEQEQGAQLVANQSSGSAEDYAIVHLITQPLPDANHSSYGKTSWGDSKSSGNNHVIPRVWGAVIEFDQNGITLQDKIDPGRTIWVPQNRIQFIEFVGRKQLDRATQ